MLVVVTVGWHERGEPTSRSGMNDDELAERVNAILGATYKGTILFLRQSFQMILFISFSSFVAL
jgi:hypothetical protein